MAQGVESSDGDLARSVAAEVPGLAEQTETELYRRFAPRVRLYGLRHLRDEEAARDLVQQVMLLTIEKLRAGSIRELDHIGPFILGVSRTMSVDLKRRDRRPRDRQAAHLHDGIGEGSMTPRCRTPLADEELLDYWIHATPASEADGIEEPLFSCDGCSARLAAMSSLGAGLSALVRRGHVAGVASRSLLNRIQRGGVQVRLYSLSPGERVPCAAFPGDDLLVLALRADLAGSETVTIRLTDGDDAVVGLAADAPVGRGDSEVLWAVPGDRVRRMPSSRLRVTLSTSVPDPTLLAEYELEHSSLD